MIQYFKIIAHRTTEVDKPDAGTWVNVLPPLRQEEFSELGKSLSIPLDFLKDSLDIDERFILMQMENPDQCVAMAAGAW